MQKGILNIADQKARREANQNSEIFKKTKENAELIKQLNIKKKAYTVLEKDFFITKSDLSAKIKKYEQLERERNNLTKANLLLNSTNMKIGSLPSINGEQGFPGIQEVHKRGSEPSNNFNSTIYVMNNGSTPFLEQSGNFGNMNRTMMNGFNGKSLGRSVDKKNWKDTRLYKGNTLSYFKKNNDNAYKMKEIKKILDEKNNIIRKQINEISNLKNTLLIKESELFGK